MNQGRGKSKNITYDYTPDGVKLSSRHVMSIQNEYGNTRRTTTDLYIDGLILRDGKPLMWQFDGGYVDLDDNGSPTGRNYYVTDHLGSTRMVVCSNDSIRETISYYPFGSEMTMQDPAQMSSDFQHPYRFTGKELDRVNGLNMYDFGARLFDVAGVPMWTSVDPLAEKYYNISPYAYCAGDPVNKFDPDGRDWLQSQGDSVYWYGGDLGDNSDLQYTFAATSGYKDDNVDYQRAMFQDIEDKGPTPEGDYFINLELDPSRTVPYEIINDRPIIKRGQGIEKVEIHYEGMLYTSPDWGTIRAKLEPQTIKNKCSRDINSFYMHNSTKGFTHGCTEVETTLFDMLVFYRERGHKKIDVRVQYPSKNHKTNGGTKR